uniref:BRL3 n=1 Tax=Arundo donax TaxID=35708 RepID=A0A0A9GTK6_ARUDO
MISPSSSLDPRSITSSKRHPAASAGSGFVPVILLNGSRSTWREEILLMTVTTKSPDSWLLLRSST